MSTSCKGGVALCPPPSDMGFFGKKTILVPIREERDFDCPDCEGLNPCTIYSEKEETRILGASVTSEEIRKLAMCGRCGTKFNLGGKEFEKPSQKAEPFSLKFVPPTDLALRQVLVGMAMADDKLAENEIQTVQTIYMTLTGDQFSDEKIRRMAAKFGKTKGQMNARLRRAAAILPIKGREVVFRAILMVANSDGFRDSDENDYLAEAGQNLKIEEKRWREIAGEFN